MGKKVKNIFRLPIFPYLFGVFYILYRSSIYTSKISYNELIFLLLIYFILCGIITLFFKVILRIKNYQIALLVWLVIIFFSANIGNFINDYFPNTWIRNRHYLAISVIIFLGILIVENRYISQYRLMVISYFLNTFLLMGACISLLIVVVKDEKKYPLLVQNEGAIVTSHTNIIWILMDEYPSSGSLMKYFKFKNPLDSFLLTSDFQLLTNIQSRYASTLFSTEAIFNFDDTIHQHSYSESVNYLKHSSWIHNLETNSYDIQTLDFLPIGQKKTIQHLFIYPTTYIDFIIAETLIYKFADAILGHIDNYNKLVLQLTDLFFKTKHTSSYFLWAHFLIPHTPFFRDEKGHLYSNAVINPAQTYLVKERFLEYLKYGNNQLIELIQADKSLKNQIFIISGDHGIRYNFVTPPDFYKPYFAIHMPWAYDTSQLKHIQYISQIPAFLMKQLVKHH